MPETEATPEQTTVHLSLDQRSYQICLGEGLLGELPQRLERQPEYGRRCALVTDENVAALYAGGVVRELQDHQFDVTEIIVPAGEASKSMESATQICRRMLQAGLDRHSFVIALGGGVIGDLAGFAASIFQRGVPLVQVPTTVVSQVDSSVGGKTGVNTPEGKNLLGAFHQPNLVLADVATLGTLPDREYLEGFAEIIKHAAIRDDAMLDLIEAQGRSREGLVPLIARNVAIKAAVVEEDERETSGLRALLNFGHTLGHGIEAAAGYGALLHGEAISLGLVAATRLSVSHSTLGEADAERLIALLRAFDLPTKLDPAIRRDAVLAALERDKKFRDGQVRFVLLRSLGDAFVSDAVSREDLAGALDRLYTED